MFGIPFLGFDNTIITRGDCPKELGYTKWASVRSNLLDSYSNEYRKYKRAMQSEICLRIIEHGDKQMFKYACSCFDKGCDIIMGATHTSDNLNRRRARVQVYIVLDIYSQWAVIIDS